MTKTEGSTKPKIAFVGLGAMGMGMAVHLLKDGFPVTGFDVNPMALETLLAMGGSAASSPRECAHDASFCICMVANSMQIEHVLFTESVGAVFGLKKDAIIILCSTVAPAFPQEVLDQVHHRFSRPDISLVDCPVSGGTLRAAQGTLTIISSGAQDALKRAQPILRSLSQTVYLIEGGLGSANKVKLINQHLAGVHIAIAAEAMGLAATIGLSTKLFYETVVQSPAHSWMFENRVPHMLSNDWSPHSALSIFVKDMVSRTHLVTHRGEDANMGHSGLSRLKVSVRTSLCISHLRQRASIGLRRELVLKKKTILASSEYSSPTICPWFQGRRTKKATQLTMSNSLI